MLSDTIKQPSEVIAGEDGVIESRTGYDERFARKSDTISREIANSRDFIYYLRDKARVNDWIVRNLAEKKKHRAYCILTLTYDNEHLPAGGELNHRDVQLFLKRFRKSIAPIKIRYFGCGEYGSRKNTHRPHYHMIVYGFCPDDLVYSHTDDSGIKFYRSKYIADLWQCGFVVVCTELSDRTIPYVCKYLNKLDHSCCKKKQPYLMCSRRGGIGCDLPDIMVDWQNDKVYYNGITRRIPLYYIRKRFNYQPHSFNEDYHVYMRPRVELQKKLVSESAFDCFAWLRKKVHNFIKLTRKCVVV